MGEFEVARVSIYEAMRRIKAELGAVGKSKQNVSQNFMYRGIDDVKNALHELLAKHGVLYVPDVVERITEPRPKGYAVHLHVRYTFYGPMGDTIVASTWGEGVDTYDKATNKAMTGAEKYMLLQTFSIPTEDQIDADAGGPPVEKPERPRQSRPSGKSKASPRPAKDRSDRPPQDDSRTSPEAGDAPPAEDRADPRPAADTGASASTDQKHAIARMVERHGLQDYYAGVLAELKIEFDQAGEAILTAAQAGSLIARLAKHAKKVAS